MKKYFSVIVFLLLLIPSRMEAQFMSSGDDPARLKWQQSEWPHFRVVFPEGLDSLANVYGNMLEKYRVSVSNSTGLEIGKYYRSKTPVILHGYNGVSNAMVAWAPKRMEFYTLGMPYETEALSWEKNLALHEARHLSQMMLGYSGKFRWFKWVSGDALPVAVSGIYTPSFLLEGDAVVSETALSDMGRGRDGNFLNYYHSAFDTGHYRNWQSWKYGSWRHYTPNHYALGYLTIAGTRAFYDDRMFMDNIYSRISRNPIRFNSIRREIKRASGMKFKPAWNGIVEGFQNNWDESAELRGPFIESEFVTEVPSWYQAYVHGTFVGDRYYAVRYGLLESSRLVIVEEDGSVTDIRPFSASTSDFYYDSALDRLYWSETFTDERWSHEASSRIRFFDLSSAHPYTPHDLTKEGRLYNPSASEDGKYVAAVEYPNAGGTVLVVLNSETGEEVERVKAPSGLQLTLTSWYENGVAAVGLSDEGMGLYKVADGVISEILAPVKARIFRLGSHDTGLVFSSDRTGVNEVYFFDGGVVRQLTSTRYGASDGVFKGDSLYFLTEETGIALEGKKKKYGEGVLLHKASPSDLLYSEIDFQSVLPDKVADVLSAQERLFETKLDWEDISPEPKKYNKLVHIPRFHSWAPLSIQYDDFAELNFDELMTAAGIGGTAYFQNDLGTAGGYVSYGYNLSPVQQEGVWANRHSGHFKFIYTGLYPVFELETHIGERPAINYYRRNDRLEDLSITNLSFAYSDRPSVNASMRIYLPLKFNSNGWYRGVTPSVYYRYSNDRYRKSEALFDHTSSLYGNVGSHGTFVGISDISTVAMQTLTTSVSAYIVQSTPSSLPYPRLGVGTQFGYHQRLGLADLYSAGVYGYVYGYLPGVFKTQAMKLTATAQYTFNALMCENSISIQPRGFVDSELGTILSMTQGLQAKASADYVFQLALPEKQWLSSVAHLTHMSIIPHFDLMSFPYANQSNNTIQGMLYTAGADITVHSNNLLWLPAPFQIGVTINYNGGPSFNGLTGDGYNLSRYHVGLIFDMDI